MSVIEKKVNVNKRFTENNCLNPKYISWANLKIKLNKEKESTKYTESEFENQIKKIFKKKKFVLNNQYDHNGVKDFLKEKEECLKKIELMIYTE